jgi:hypothetical protein
MSTTTENITRVVDATFAELIERLLAERAEHTVRPALALGRYTRVWARRDGCNSYTAIDRYPGGGYRLRTTHGHGVYQFTEDVFTEQADHDSEVAVAAKINADLEAAFGR